ncbi:hypothetical protein [Mesobacillus jeotgali]|uniref:General stress protein n=1 Tax=Mesobacillus jeotgali TaxID=129985 RepID=A0ABY9VUK2_9BACI|nr:hypothetical protein [Mesobacillus jeotgali]WNF24676.1 hypothetical protein RH061_09380 [Mesobacillus jeotgali]
MQKRVKKKLVSLYTGELFAVFIFALMWVLYILLFEWSVPYLTSYSSLYAFILLEFILLQGSYYWYLKLKQIQNHELVLLPDRQLRTFANLKRVNEGLLLIGVFVSIYQIISKPIEFYWFVFLFLFAVIEHINYYYVRLSYQTVEDIKELKRQKGFRRSRLAKELDSFLK